MIFDYCSQKRSLTTIFECIMSSFVFFLFKIMSSFVDENVVSYCSSHLVSNKKFIFKRQINLCLRLEIGKIDNGPPQKKE